MAEETPGAPLPPQSPPVVTASRTEPLAIWSLVLSIASFLGCLFFTLIPAIICGHLARSRIRKSNGVLQGMNLALASLIVAYIQIPIGVLGGIMLADMIRSEVARRHDLELQKKEIASDDGKVKITTSGFWVKRSDLNKQASLQAARPDRDDFLIVIGDPKNSVGEMTLQKHHQLTRDHMLHEMANSSGTDPISITIDGHSALQDELRGKGKGKDLVFLHTTIDEDESFQQIIAWTVRWRWPKENQELRDVTNSFHSENQP